MKRKIIPVLIAIFLILVIGAMTVGSELKEKYSYATERVDLDEYFQVSGNQLAILLQDDVIEEKGILKDGICYFDLDTIHRYFNDGFFVDHNEGLLLYTTAVEIISVPLGGDTMSSKKAVSEEPMTEALGYVAAYKEKDTVYVAADYVRKFTNYSVEVFDGRVQVYTQWGKREIDTVKKDTAVRVKSDRKSPILSDLAAGTTVEVLERMETWCKVKTEDSIIGYVEIKLLEQASIGQGLAMEEKPVTDYKEPEYTTISMDGKVSLGWHSVGGAGGNSTLETVVAGAKGMNVIAPTWFSLSDEEGNFRSFGSKDYVDRAHAMGLEVWGVWDDFNYNMDTKSSVSVAAVLSRTSTRQRLAGNIVQTAVLLGLDGVNLDFERIGEASAPDYLQFIKELSVECRKNGLVFSIDNYVPFDYRSFFRLDIQGKVADYVIIMGYDEHHFEGDTPGSVASIGYVKNGITKALENVPANKLVNGLPFYTYLWKSAGTNVEAEYLSIKNTPAFLNRLKLTPKWDNETCQNYVEWTSGGVKYQLWLEDEESIATKLSVMTAQNIAGVAVWRLGYGTESIWNLIRGYVSQ